jgi:hypothetical protein
MIIAPRGSRLVPCCEGRNVACPEFSEAGGLIRREIDANDGRRRISLRPAGWRKLRAGLRAAEQADGDVLGALAPRELDSLRKTMLRAYRSSEPETTDTLPAGEGVKKARNRLFKRS